MNVVSKDVVEILARQYVDRLIADGHEPGKALSLARARAGREIVAGMKAGPSETEQLADRVRDREPGATIVQLTDRLVKETRGLSREQAFVQAERMIRGR